MKKSYAILLDEAATKIEFISAGESRYESAYNVIRVQREKKREKKCQDLCLWNFPNAINKLIHETEKLGIRVNDVAINNDKYCFRFIQYSDKFENELKDLEDKCKEASFPHISFRCNKRFNPNFYELEIGPFHYDFKNENENKYAINTLMKYIYNFEMNAEKYIELMKEIKKGEKKNKKSCNCKTCSKNCKTCNNKKCKKKKSKK